ncbi:MAG: hypothetical protein JSU74_12455 [Candidatus Zixiibacteriota bacterium]|nr:MAG: hypothetical protein JSU74_12455 [candidate division Zixibacteria bacterium]
MSRKMFLSFCAAALLILSVQPDARADEAAEVKFVNHELTITLDVPDHTAEFIEDGSAEIQGGWNLFKLASGAAVTEFTIDDNPVEFLVLAANDTAGWPEELTLDLSEIDTTAQYNNILFRSDTAKTAAFHLAYGGQFYQDVANTRFSNEMVGKEITATIDEKGAYFSSEAYFYPVGSEDAAHFRLAATIPETWESISDGNRLDSDNVSGRKFQTWENPFESDGLTFFAAPFEVGYVQADSVGVYCYFFAEDTSLMERYLSASADYIRMYDELIGPYPYRRFTVAENFFPTGYGMPGWTLLGQQVLRLPFIVATSLGHEVLHNWWGNSVFVNYEEGNWCEGITVYGADYRYKMMRSAVEARDYRKNILKQYVSYVNEGNDFPLSEFTSRTSPGTRTVGYNKSMMVFHMIENLIGSEAFFGAWKNVFEACQGHKVSWQDWIVAFEKTSGEDLSYIMTEWVERTGAPVIAVDVVEEATSAEANTRTVRLRLSENSGDSYKLQVPLRFSGGGYSLDTAVVLDQTQKEFSFTVSDAAMTLDVDPDYHLFRKLYPEEVEPVISAILGNPSKRFICEDSRIEPVDNFREFGLNMTGDSIQITATKPADTTPGAFAVILDFGQLPDYLQPLISLTEDSVTVAGNSYERGSHTCILTGQDWMGFEKYMFIITQDYESLPRIGQLIPHYGKYSYLVFEATKNVGKGQWEPEHSPLKIKLAQAPTEGGN